MTSTLTPVAARLHCLAAFITEHDLPPASITIHAAADIVAFSFHDSEHPENALRRYAQTLGFIVREQPYEDGRGCAAEMLGAAGFIDGVYYTATWLRPVVATVSG